MFHKIFAVYTSEDIHAPVSNEALGIHVKPEKEEMETPHPPETEMLIVYS